MRDLLAEWVKQTVVWQARWKRNVIEYLDVYDDVIKLQSENPAIFSNTQNVPSWPWTLFQNVNQWIELWWYIDFIPNP